MTREEQIKEKARRIAGVQESWMLPCLIEMANWADENPDPQMIRFNKPILEDIEKILKLEAMLKISESTFKDILTAQGRECLVDGCTCVFNFVREAQDKIKALEEPNTARTDKP